MKSKKMISMLLSLMLMSSGLVGCSGGSNEKGQTTGKEQNAEVTVADDGREMVGNMYTTGLPIVKEEESFSIFVDDSSTDVASKYIYPILEEQTNVKVEFLAFPYEIAKEKKNILLNSGDYPDVFGGWILTENEILNDGMGEGLYIPINEYIDQYAPNMQEMLSYEGVRDTMTLPDGNIYTIPYVIETPLVAFLPWINTAWLERVGKEMPTTTEELRDVLRAFKEQDANGNGDPNDEIPFSADPVNKNLGMLAGWFGVSADNPAGYFAMEDGKIEFQANKEEYKEYIKYMASLYKEGLIDPEIFTQDSATWKSKGQQGLYGVSIAYGPGDFYQDPNILGPFEFTALPVLKSDLTDKPVYKRGSYGSTTFKTQVAITDKAENPEVIVRWFDNVFEIDNSVQIQWGPFGKRVEKLGEGQYRALDENLLTEEEKKIYNWGELYSQSLPKFIPLGVKLQPAEGVKVAEDLKIPADAMYEPFLDEQVPAVWATSEVKDKLTILQTDIVNYVDQKQGEWISGQADVDAEWDSYLEQLDTYGLQELIQIKKDLIEK